MRVVVSLGSNVGERLAHLQAGLDALSRVVAVSPVYETAPVGGPAQPDYLNAVALLECADARAAFDAGQTAERAQGREREERWGPRTLDVDVVDADVPSNDPDLVVPHPRAAQRGFVLLPWLDVEPAATLDGVAVRELAGRVDMSGLRRTELRLVVR